MILNIKILTHSLIVSKSDKISPPGRYPAGLLPEAYRRIKSYIGGGVVLIWGTVQLKKKLPKNFCDMTIVLKLNKKFSPVFQKLDFNSFFIEQYMYLT